MVRIDNARIMDAYGRNELTFGEKGVWGCRELFIFVALKSFKIDQILGVNGFFSVQPIGEGGTMDSEVWVTQGKIGGEIVDFWE